MMDTPRRLSRGFLQLAQSVSGCEQSGSGSQPGKELLQAWRWRFFWRSRLEHADRDAVRRDVIWRSPHSE